MKQVTFKKTICSVMCFTIYCILTCCILNRTKYIYKHTVLHVARSPQGLKKSPSERSSSLKIIRV